MTKADKLRQVYRKLEKAAPQLPLAHVANDIVPGEGSVDAQIMFIGEAPGYYESIQRRPFVGKSGQLFRKILREVGGFSEEEVYISNIVKVRPPENRDPLPHEIEAFKPFLDQEISIIQPEVIVTLGRFSMGKFLPDARVSQVHGRLHKLKWHNQIMFVLPMYHPAAALRAPKIKISFTEDFKRLPKIMNWLHEQKDVIALKQDVIDTLL